MYQRPDTLRAASYSYPASPMQATPKHYPTAHSTSSAFSASANPNEDWTKISDLAERRRIQNRIAQRNYRKKLKRRLEDLEKRAGSSSASPEQRHAELSQEETASNASSVGHSRQRSTSNQMARDRMPEVLNQQYVLPSDDRSMFSQQYTRQLSTSPPPFSYTAMPTAANTEFASYAAPGYCGIQSAVTNMPFYPQYLPPLRQHPGVPSMANHQIKQEFCDDMSPFSMSYASMAGVDVPAAQSYHDVAAYVSTGAQYSRA